MKNSLLWEAVHPRTKVMHYLYGTMHVSNDAAYKHLPLVRSYLEHCTLYAGEMDLADPKLIQLTSYFELPTGISLQSLYGSKKYQKLHKVVRQAFDVDLDRYSRLRPMIIANMLAEKILTASHPIALDQYLWSLATELQIDTTGIESADQQIDILQMCIRDRTTIQATEIERNIAPVTQLVNHFITNI